MDPARGRGRPEGDQPSPAPQGTGLVPAARAPLDTLPVEEAPTEPTFTPREITERVVRKVRPELEAQTDATTARKPPAARGALPGTDAGTTQPSTAVDDEESSTLAEQDREIVHHLALGDDDESATLADPKIKAPGYEPEPSPDVPLLDEPSHAGETRRIRPGEVAHGPALPFRPSAQAVVASRPVARPTPVASSGTWPGAPVSESAWATDSALDPTALPSSQLAQLARPDAPEPAASAGRAKSSHLSLVLLGVALVLGFVITALMLHC
jgi:hypothetical protein